MNLRPHERFPVMAFCLLVLLSVATTVAQCSAMRRGLTHPGTVVPQIRFLH